MSDTVIQAEGLGKKYLIGHQSERERYTALRDVLARNVKGLWNKTRQVLSGQQLLAGDEVEEFWALRDINFEIKRGDRVGIIGRNGAGKSTLLKVLSRITEPSAGKVTIKGRVASLLEVGTGFHPELTGRENIYLNGAILGMTQIEIKKKFDDIVDFSGVERFLDTPVKRYSSGMYVRLAFAVAAHLEPEILVVDEVLAVGDAEFQKKAMGKMQEVSKEGDRTVLFVSHNMGSISQLCSKVILVEKGQLAFFGETRAGIEKFFHSKPMEFKSDPKNKEIFFHSLNTVNSSGEFTSNFSHLEDIILRIHVIINKKDPLYNIGVVLLDRNKSRVFTVNKLVQNLINPAINDFCVDFVIEGGLIAPNDYSFLVALNTPTGIQTYDWAEDVCPIKIYDQGSNLAFAEGTSYGSILLKDKWKLVHLNQS